MIIHSDWHIHSDASYDSKLPISEIERVSLEFGFKKFGITDHLNFNDTKFLADIAKSAKAYTELSGRCDRAVLGVELTPIHKEHFDYIARHGSLDGYTAREFTCYGIELAQTKDELCALGVRYAIGAAHWRIDEPNARYADPDMDACIKEWHRQQMWLACDERVTILGHPWYNGNGLWYNDFSHIPRLHVEELSAALKENGKYVECNSHFFNTPLASEKFKHQYADFLRNLFEMGIPVTYGSDSHNQYLANHLATEKYLMAAGFKDGDISELDASVLW